MRRQFTWLGILGSLLWLTSCGGGEPVPETNTLEKKEQQLASPEQPQANLLSTADTAAIVDEAAVKEIVTLPGLEQRDYVGPLADAYDRIDPSKDGWDTEAFNEAASTQLIALAKWLAVGEGAMPLALAPNCQTAAWSGGDLDLVFEDSGLVVHRMNAADSNAPPMLGKEGFRLAAESFRKTFASEFTKVKFKLYRLEPKDAMVETRVLLEASGKDHEARKVQVSAEWLLRWQAEDPPLLESIQVLAYERSRYLAKPLYQDHTVAVLGKTTTFRDQILRGADHWRGRIPRDLGIDVVANHGLALGDVNGDLLDDLYLCMQGGLPNRLYLRNADGTLTDASADSGADWLDYCASALIIDVNNDGRRDLVVAQEWRILVMENDGQGHFELAFGLSTNAQTFSISSADYDRDGDLDLFVCGYNPAADNIRQGAMGEPMPYHDAQNGGRNMLLRNDGDWEFNEVTPLVGLEQNNNRFSFAASWEDYDNDGDLDLYVANDYGRNNLYKQDNGRFVDVAGSLGIEDMSSGMSVAWGDYNLDGKMDLYVSNMFSAAGNRITYQRQFKQGQKDDVLRVFRRHARGNSLFESTGDGQFRDVSVTANVTMGRWAWGSAFVDINNDSHQDLLVANGFITSQDTGDL